MWPLRGRIVLAAPSQGLGKGASMGRELARRGPLLVLAVWLQACATGAVASGGLLPSVGLTPGGTQGVVLFRELRKEELSRRSRRWCPE